MVTRNRTAPDIFSAATKAVAALFFDGFEQVRSIGVTQAISVHSDIEQAPLVSKSARFYACFVLLRSEMISLLVKAYRGFFKVAIANPSQTDNYPDLWARIQLERAIYACLEWIPSWYTLACDGQNQTVWRLASMPFAPGQTVSIPIQFAAPAPPKLGSWQAPSWLFQIGRAYFGIG